MDIALVSVPDFGNSELIPNEQKILPSTQIGLAFIQLKINPAIRNAKLLIDLAFILIPSLTRCAVHIFFRYTHSNSQMCISVIETKRCPIHGLVSLRSGYAEIPPGLPAKHIPPNPLDGG